MRVPERLLGFLEYDNAEIAFEFCEDAFTLNLYPQKELWKKYAHPSYAFGNHSFDYKKHEWISSLNLCGKNSSGQTVIFSVQEDASYYHGFLSFRVNWYFCCYDGMDENHIHGFYIDGDVVDAFYLPQNILDRQLEYDKENHQRRLVLTSADHQLCSCGSYMLNENVRAEIAVESYVSYGIGNVEKPISVNSRLRMDFSESLTIDEVLEAVTHTLRFLIFITYRANVPLELIHLCGEDECGKCDDMGILVFPKEERIEKNKDAKNQLITYQHLGEKVADIFADIKRKQLSFQHICENADARRSYPISRVIMIFAAFERVYGQVYGKDTERSQLYIETKEKVVELIAEHEKDCTGKQKKYVRTLKDFVANRDSSFASNLTYALKDCAEIMTPFVKRRYEGEYEDIVEQISERIGVVRNGVAHCRLDFKLEAIHLSDIHIVEELLYAIELKHVGLSAQECKKAIGKLFGENMVFREEKESEKGDHAE